MASIELFSKSIFGFQEYKSGQKSILGGRSANIADGKVSETLCIGEVSTRKNERKLVLLYSISGIKVYKIVGIVVLEVAEVIALCVEAEVELRAKSKSQV